MNKVYKIIWSKVRNCYMVVSELAKNHTKTSVHASHAVVAGVLLSLLSGGIAAPVWADAVNVTSPDNENPNTVTNANTVVVGKDNILNGNEIVVLGSDNTVGSDAIQMEKVLVLGNHNSVLFDSTDYDSTDAIIVGFDSKSGEGSVAVGNNVNTDFYDYSTTDAIGTYTLTLGFGAYSEGNGSIALGAGSYTQDDGSVSIGQWATSNGANGVVIGSNASAFGLNSTIVGAEASTNNENAVAVGHMAYVFGDDSVAVGADSQASDANATAVGFNAVATKSSVAVGYQSWANEENSIAIGASSNASASNAVALGANSLANEEYTVSVGNSTDGIKRRITNVADGVNDTDVPTMKQLNKVADTKVLAGNNIYVAEGVDSNGVKQFTISAVVDSSNLEINGDGVIEKDNIGLVSGNTVYNEVHVDTDGSYIKSANTVGNNLSALDTNLKNLSDKTVYLGMKANINPYDIHTQYLAGGHQLGDLVTTNQPSDTIARYNEEYSNEDGIGAVGNRSIAIGQFNIAYGDDTITIGNQALSVGTSKVNPIRVYGLPKTQTTSGANSVLVGNHTLNEGDRNVALGYYAQTVFFDNRVMEAGHTYEAKNDVAVGASSLASGENATAVGEHSYAASGGSALGSQASASNYSVSVGYNASTVYNWVSREPFNQSLIAIGKDSRSESTIPFGIDAISIGNGAKAIDGLAIGDSSVSQSFGSIVIGNHSTSKNVVTLSSENADNLDKNIILGSNSYYGYTSGKAGNVLLGNHVYSWGNVSNSVAIGNNSTVTSDNVVSFGHRANENTSNSDYKYDTALNRRLVNVADGISSSDVATVGQLDKVFAGNNVSVSSYTAYNGATNKTINVNTDGLVEKGNTGIVTGNTVYNAIQKQQEQFAIRGIGSVTVSDVYSQPVIKTISDIVTPLSSGSEKTSALSNALNAYGSVVEGDPLVPLGVTNSEMSDFMGSLYNGTLYGSMTQERFDEIMQMSLTLEKEKFEAKEIAVKKDGLVASGNTDVVTGDTVYNAIQDALQDVGSVDVTNKANIDAENVTDAQAWANKLGIGTVNTEDTRLVTGSAVAGETRLATDGNYVLSDKTAGENISILDTSLKALDTIAVKYDGEDLATATLAGTSGTKLTNLKPATLSASSTDAVIGAQLYAVKQDITGFASDINRNKESIRELNTSVSSALSSVSSTSLLVDTIDGLKADVSLNNLSNAGRQVISTAAVNAVQEYLSANPVLGINCPVTVSTSFSPSNTLNVTDAGNGSLHVGEGSFVNGTSSIAIGVGNQVNANNSGAFGDPSIINADASYVLGNDDTVNAGATGTFIVGNDSVSDAKGALLFGSNNTASASAENSVALGNNTQLKGRNSVAIGSGSTALEDNVVSVGNNTLQRRITNIASGNLLADSTDAVTGGQLYDTNLRVSAVENTLETKADTDGSNIDINKWADKLGIGKVEPGDGNLVTGETVYTAMRKLDTGLINAGENAIYIGGLQQYDGIDSISIAKSDGTARVLQGVATNPDDPSSAANVSYVNAVGQNIVNQVNDRFVRMDDRMDKVGAGAAAMAGLVPGPMDGDECISFSAGVGNYRSATAGAVGAFYKPSDNVMLAVKGAFGNGENMVSGSIGVSLNKGNVPGVTKAQMVRTINTQAQKIKALESVQQQNTAEREQDRTLIREQASRIEKLEAALQQVLDMQKKASE